MFYGIYCPGIDVYHQPKKDITCQQVHRSDFPSLLSCFGSLPATRLSTTLSWWEWFARMWQRRERSASFMHIAHIYEALVIWPKLIILWEQERELGWALRRLDFLNLTCDLSILCLGLVGKESKPMSMHLFFLCKRFPLHRGCQFGTHH